MKTLMDEILSSKDETLVYMRRKSLRRSKGKMEISMKHKLAGSAIAIGLPPRVSLLRAKRIRPANY